MVRSRDAGYTILVSCYCIKRCKVHSKRAEQVDYIWVTTRLHVVHGADAELTLVIYHLLLMPNKVLH